MTIAEYEAANLIAPNMNKIAVINVTTSSVAHDLSSIMGAMTGASGPATAEYQRGLLTLVADGGKVWFFFNVDGTGTVDETADTAAGTAANRCMMIPDGGRMDFRLNAKFHFIEVKGSAACRLRIYRSSAGGPGDVPT